MRPDISVIVATYDRPAMLEVELHSILASAATVKRHGIRVRPVVIDDASPTMAAWGICKRMAVPYIRRPERGGVAAALATGWEATDGKWSSFWGDDDYMLPRWCAAHWEMAAEGYDVVSGSYWLADAQLRPVQEWTLRPATLGRLLANEVDANDGSLVRRDVVEKVGLRPDRERAMLLTFWLGCAKAGMTFAAVAEPTWYYRRHDGQLSGQPDERFIALRQAAIAEARA